MIFFAGKAICIPLFSLPSRTFHLFIFAVFHSSKDNMAAFWYRKVSKAFFSTLACYQVTKASWKPNDLLKAKKLKVQKFSRVESKKYSPHPTLLIFHSYNKFLINKLIVKIFLLSWKLKAKNLVRKIWRSQSQKSWRQNLNEIFKKAERNWSPNCENNHNQFKLFWDFHWNGHADLYSIQSRTQVVLLKSAVDYSRIIANHHKFANHE